MKVTLLHFKNIFSIALLLFITPYSMTGQEELVKYVNGNELTVSGISKAGDPASFYRVDSTLLNGLPATVKKLAKNPAGAAILFKTDSRSIKVKWELEKYKIWWNMSPLTVNGMDLYGWNGSSWQYVASARPSGTENKATIIDHMDGQMRHYMMYLPLYSTLRSVSIGVEKDATIRKADPQFLPKRSIAIYGSSITQGASASRPGMAYPSIIGRAMQAEVYNFGFSGSGKMELGAADFVRESDADVYILDCVPNPSPEQIAFRTVPFVKRLRKSHPDTPVIMVESLFREHGHWDLKTGKRVTAQCRAFRDAYKQLVESGEKDIFYISNSKLIGDDHEATSDGTHLSDIGHHRIAQRLIKILRESIQLPD
ncbi:SGNH/GDSL hydrolase family protein [Sinomicrobium weinanense]|uniref:SGNH/GDSL hydrolase family protein n=1 Tax=Sinomicrobium weinanense TaxID=2842200 RepID=A0A926JUE4_9FLAO|nr:SGNH/GDSL hydrolase family protein [Sinomicrobium weinanense]MBC9797427.1 SGNH/GDSL hydrolase family protein [Sinomicrobium weinanense]MBU3123079.1 SGNH/GDSL hydrolase family protein [Sinomicrobium weinanense]